MSDPDLDLIQQTHDAHTALMARINGFLDQVDGDVAAAIALAQAELATRQGAYDQMAADLAGVVADQLQMTISWTPDAPAADLSDGGVARTWVEVNSFINAAPPDCAIIIELDDGDHEITQTGISRSNERRSIEFRGIGNNVAGSRPRIFATPYENNGFSAMPFISLVNSSLTFYKVDVDLGSFAGATTSFNANRMLIRSFGINKIHLIQAKIEGDADHLVRVYDGTIAQVRIDNVAVDGLSLFYGDGILLASTINLALTNGGSLQTGFTLGANLLET